MDIWLESWNHVRLLHPAFIRTRTFIWFAVALAAMSLRTDLFGLPVWSALWDYRTDATTGCWISSTAGRSSSTT